MPKTWLFLPFVFLFSLSSMTLSACDSGQSDEIRMISEREAYYINMAPQGGIVAYNRVEAFIQAHDFMDALQAALSDNQFSEDELEKIAQLAANAEASLYNTGDWQLFEYARLIDTLSKHAFRGEISQAQEGLGQLKRSLPRRPRP